MIVLGVVLLTSAATLIGVSTAGHLMNKPNTALHRDNTTVILTQVHHFFTKSLTVTQDTGYPGDTDHEIAVYRVNTKCSDLSAREQMYTVNGNDLSAINKTTLYLLAGSSITYSICGSTNQTRRPERLELVLLDDLERAQSLENIANSFYKFAYFSTGRVGEKRCDKVPINIDTTGYYTTLFLPPPHPAHFEFNITYNVRTIDLTQLSIVSNHTLRVDQDSHEFPLEFGVKSSCCVATIKKASKAYVHIQLDLKSHLELKVGLGVGSALLTVALVSTIVVFVLFCCKSNSLRNQ